MRRRDSETAQWELGRAIRKGSVCVNGEHVKDPGMKVSSEDEILPTAKLSVRRTMFIICSTNLAGVSSATEDGREMTVLDLLRNPSNTGTGAAGGPERDSLQNPPRRGSFPVGRLDKMQRGFF